MNGSFCRILRYVLAFVATATRLRRASSATKTTSFKMPTNLIHSVLNNFSKTVRE